MTDQSELYNVVQFFPDDSYEYIKRNIPAEEAVKTFKFFTSNVSARIGLTKRVIIIDMGDCIAMEWISGKGITFPNKEEIEKEN